MKQIIIILFLLLNFFESISQNHYTNKADEFFSYLKYTEAIDNYKEGLKYKGVDSTYIYKQIGQSYFALKNYEGALSWYSKYFKRSEEVNPQVMLAYANLLRNYEKYDSALIMYQRYGAESQKFDFENDFIDLCKFPKSDNIEGNCSSKIDLTDLNVGRDNMGIGFIDAGLLYSKPIKDKESKKTVYYDLYSASTRDSIQFEDIPSAFGETNSLYYDGAPFVFDHGGKLLFTRNYKTIKTYRADSKKDVLKNSKGVNLLQIYYMEKNEEGKWSDPSLIKFENQNVNYAFPFYDSIDKILYFSSDLAGGIGGFDIYSVPFSDGQAVGAPQSLGKSINSFDNDIYPYKIGSKLFYSSKGKPGFGGYDLFVSELNESKSYSEPVNLGNSLNSSFDDFNMILDASYNGYFASNRNNYNGEDKVYRVQLKFARSYRGTVINKETGAELENVAVVVYEKNNGEWTEVNRVYSDSKGSYTLDLDDSSEQLIVYDHFDFCTDSLEFGENVDENQLNRELDPLKEIVITVLDKITKHPLEGVEISLSDEKGIVDTHLTDSNGVWEFTSDKNRNYSVDLNDSNYESIKFDLPEPAKEVTRFELELSPIAKIGNVLQIDNVYFDFNKSSIRKDSYEIMDNIYNYLMVNNTIKVELSAHTDCIGKDSYNLRLSTSRANSCYEYLIKKGISSDRIIPKGYGETKMVAPDCKRQRVDDDYAQKNRRVEVKILE